MRDICQEVRDVMAAVFVVAPADVGEDASPETIESWDSLRHLSLILALEERFGISLSIDEITSLGDFLSVVAAVSRHLGVPVTANGHVDGRR
jgi:acyl carrier protein